VHGLDSTLDLLPTAAALSGATLPLLFNLDHDPGENYNVADKHPEVLKRIAALRKKHEASIKPVEDQLAGRAAK